jgi:hypothetical protein
MAGNDLQSMTDSVRAVLTAKEVIGINQDARGVQGYKVFDDGDREIYNKPLADGTTAVMLLNKGSTAADLTVTWEQNRAHRLPVSKRRLGAQGFGHLHGPLHRPEPAAT